MKIFQIETTLNNDTFGDSGPHVDVCRSASGSGRPRTGRCSWRMQAGLKRMPARAKRAAFMSWKSPYAVTSVQAGEVEAVHEETLEHFFAQHLVPVEGQTDVLTMGLPYICPYNVNCDHEPDPGHVPRARLLLQPVPRQAPGAGGRGADHDATPRRGSSTRCTTRATSTSSNRSCPRPPIRIEVQKYEKDFAEDEWYRHLYRTSYAYHGVHPFYMWYWGSHALQHLGKVIIVGGDPKAVRRLGFAPAITMQRRLRTGVRRRRPQADDHARPQPADPHGGRDVKLPAPVDPRRCCGTRSSRCARPTTPTGVEPPPPAKRRPAPTTTPSGPGRSPPVGPAPSCSNRCCARRSPASPDRPAGAWTA